jgi:phospholipid transport system transporter-binding protein
MTFLLPKTVTQENALLLEKEGLSVVPLMSTVDCSALQDFDSTVLTVFLSWQKKIAADHQKITFIQPPEKLKVLAGVYGVSELLGF